MPTITVSAHDFMSRLTEGSKERSFPWFLPDSLVAVIVAAENFLITEPDPAAAVVGALNVFNQRPRSQYKQSDYKFLRQIAAEYGFDMWVDGDFMNFRFLLPRVPRPMSSCLGRVAGGVLTEAHEHRRARGRHPQGLDPEILRPSSPSRPAGTATPSASG